MKETILEVRVHHPGRKPGQPLAKSMNMVAVHHHSNNHMVRIDSLTQEVKLNMLTHIKTIILRHQIRGDNTNKDPLDFHQGDQLTAEVHLLNNLDNGPEDRLPEDRLPEDHHPEDHHPEDHHPEDCLPEDCQVQGVLCQELQVDKVLDLMVSEILDKTNRGTDHHFQINFKDQDSVDPTPQDNLSNLCMDNKQEIRL
jgi:hypothetical protein